MKKMAFLTAVVMVFSMFSFSAFAQNLTEPGTSDLTLNAS